MLFVSTKSCGKGYVEGGYRTVNVSGVIRGMLYYLEIRS